MVLEGREDFTLDGLRDAAYDSYLTSFAELVPQLVEAWAARPASDPLKTKLAGPVAALEAWDYRWSVDSVPTSVAMFWGEPIVRWYLQRL